jgi:hypothetical protein
MKLNANFNLSRSGECVKSFSKNFPRFLYRPAGRIVVPCVDLEQQTARAFPAGTHPSDREYPPIMGTVTGAARFQYCIEFSSDRRRLDAQGVRQTSGDRLASMFGSEILTCEDPKMGPNSVNSMELCPFHVSEPHHRHQAWLVLHWDSWAFAAPGITIYLKPTARSLGRGTSLHRLN